MTSRGFQIGVGLLIVVVVAIVIVRAQDGGDDRRATADEAKRALADLPYRYRFRKVEPPDGAESAIAGTAYGRDGSALDFGATFGGSPKAMSIPGSGATGAVELEGAVITTGQRRKGNEGASRGGQAPVANERPSEVDAMAVEILEAICEAVSGDPCPASEPGAKVGGPAGKAEGPFRTIDQGSLPE